jgi:hypothetical protein
MEIDARPFPGGKNVKVEMPTTVRFTGKGGFAAENKRANEALVVGTEYGIFTLNIGRSSSTVDIYDYETGKPMGAWNTVMFDFIAWEWDYDPVGTYL